MSDKPKPVEQAQMDAARNKFIHDITRENADLRLKVFNARILWFTLGIILGFTAGAAGASLFTVPL